MSSTRKVNKYTKPGRGFSLVELLVSLAIFASMAAIAWGALASIANTRGALVSEEDDLRSLMATVDSLQRDLRQAVARPVRGNYGETLPVFAGAADRLEFTRLGFANPQAELRSNLERIGYGFDGKRLIRANYPVLDRAPNTQPRTRMLHDRINAVRLRYLDPEARWVASWPEASANANDPKLPRAVEIRLDTADYGEITSIVELASDFRGSAITTAPTATP